MIERLHALRIIALSRRNSEREDLLQAPPLIRCKSDLDCAEIIFEIADVFCAGYRNDVFALSKHPGKRSLRRRDPFFISQPPDCISQVKIVLKIFSCEAGVKAAPVAFRYIFLFLETPGEETTTKWAVCDKTNLKFPASGKNFRFRITAPQRIFGL